MTYNVFISHSMRPSDLPLIQTLCENLARHGIACHVAGRDGDAPDPSLEQAIRAADCLLAFLTQGGTGAGHVQEELEIASRLSKPAVVLVESNVDLTGFPARVDYVEFDRSVPSNWLHKLSARVNEMAVPLDLRQALFWGVVMTAATLFVANHGPGTGPSGGPGA
jgi:hypothetical protein